MHLCAMATMTEEIVLTERVEEAAPASKIDSNAQVRDGGSHEEQPVYPHGFHFALISASLVLTVFLTGLVSPSFLIEHSWSLKGLRMKLS